MEDIIKKINKQVHTHLEEFKDRIISEHVDEFLGGGAPEELEKFWHEQFKEIYEDTLRNASLFNLDELCLNCDAEYVFSKIPDYVEANSNSYIQWLDMFVDNDIFTIEEAAEDSHPLINNPYFCKLYREKDIYGIKKFLAPISFDETYGLLGDLKSNISKKRQKLMEDLNLPENFAFAPVTELMSAKRFMKKALIEKLEDPVALGDSLLETGLLLDAVTTYSEAIKGDKGRNYRAFRKSLWAAYICGEVFSETEGYDKSIIPRTFHTFLESVVDEVIDMTKFGFDFLDVYDESKYRKTIDDFKSEISKISAVLNKKKVNKSRYLHMFLYNTYYAAQIYVAANEVIKHLADTYPDFDFIYAETNKNYIDFGKKWEYHLLKALRLDKEVLSDYDSLKSFFETSKDLGAKLLLERHFCTKLHDDFTKRKEFFTPGMRDDVLFSINHDLLKQSMCASEYLYKMGYRKPETCFNLASFTKSYEDFKGYIDEIDLNKLNESELSSLSKTAMVFADKFERIGLYARADQIKDIFEIYDNKDNCLRFEDFYGKAGDKKKTN